MAKKTSSKYEQKLERRRSAGAVHYRLPVDRGGFATLNRTDMVMENGQPRTRAFSRLRRSDEI